MAAGGGGQKNPLRSAVPILIHKRYCVVKNKKNEDKEKEQQIIIFAFNKLK